MIYGDLRKEINNDPLGRGYSNMTDQEVADDLNTEYRTRVHKQFSGGDLLDQIVESEWNSLTESQQEKVKMMVQSDGTFNARDGRPRTILENVFGSNSSTIGNIDSAATESISRAEELGLGTVYRYHIENIRS